MLNSLKVTILFLFFCISSITVFGQKGHFSDPNYSPNDYDIVDGLRKKKAAKLKASGDTVTTKPKDKKVYTIVLPVVAYNPFTGLILGVGGIGSFRLGADPEKTRLSSVVPSYTWTTNNQNIVRINSSLYTNEEKYYIFNSITWSVSPQVTYGVGGNTQEQWSTQVSPSVFKFVLRGYKKVKKDFFVGVNFNYDQKYKLVDDSAEGMRDIINNGKNDGQTADQVQSAIDTKYGDNKYDTFWEQNNVDQNGFASDYNADKPTNELQQNYYPTPFGYHPYGTQERYIYSGIGINLLYDSRDNINTPFKGSYANLIVNTYQDWLGSTYNSTSIYADLRHYVNLNKNYTQILAFWGLANLTFGDTPYLNLPRIGGDDWYSSGRGYTAGRYLGEKLLYLEAEYRVNLYKWFGMTAFVNAHTVSELNGEFSYVNPGGGLGFRFQVIKKSRSTINFDYGVGKDGSSGAYMRFISAF
ncbi:hypothetical protein EI427_20750 [Flammeovirga pectinis]|uniref:Bacterial surface antigen (D15) domain-containing protein n=1 Tax=Flammeovirga pectinis TaxID=2494373 RepID=A0A3Q9FUD6_9BACT|nr:hypothetical protein [Flammeovirga pectinis]AZQ64656.1 hypothetical protein EI427_20750 [Flammeovirga pectinis]